MKKFRLRLPRRGARGSQNPSTLVFFLSFIILVETLLLLFLLSQKAPSREHVSRYKRGFKQEGRSLALKKTAAKMPQPERAQQAIKERVSSSEETTQVQVLPKGQRGKIAIVLDDWGYSADNLDMLGQIQAPLTVAILPFHEYSRTVAEFANRHNFQVIIHMPMEPKNKERVGLESMTLLTHMDKKTINRILKDAFEDIPHAEGINNHMGSLATENEAFITTVFQYLKKKKVFFLDSYVTTGSVCLRIARERGIKFARRSVFLDNSSNPAYISQQLEKLASQSDAHGYALGIGHDRKATLGVLLEKIPELEKRGYRFVFVSALVE